MLRSDNMRSWRRAPSGSSIQRSAINPSSCYFLEWPRHSVVKDSDARRLRSGSKCSEDVMKRWCDVGERVDHPRGHRGSRRLLHWRCGRGCSSLSEDQRTNQLRRQQRIKRAFTQTVRGNLLHHQSGAEIFYIHIYQVVEFRVNPNSPLCNLGLFQSEVGSVWDVFEYRKSKSGWISSSDRRQRTREARKVNSRDFTLIN